jgi:hypothetical protein
MPAYRGGRHLSENLCKEEGSTMLETIIVILVILWALGFFAFHVSSGLIHLLLVIAVVVLIVRLLQGRRVL